MKSTEVVVVGLGIMGSALLAQLSKRGCSVIGLDRYQPPHELGSSHSHSRAIRRAYFEDPRYVPLVARSYELWHEWSQASPLIKTTGALMLGLPTSQVVKGTLASAQTHQLQHEYLQARDLKKRYPSFRFNAEFVGVYEPDAGLISPEAAVDLFLRHARDSGAEICLNSELTSWRQEKDQIVMTGKNLSITCKSLVFCVGGWSQKLLDQGSSCSPYRVIQFWFDSGGQQHFESPHFPINIWDLPDGRVVYAFPDNDGRGVKVGFHEMREKVEMEGYNRYVSDHEREEMSSLANTLWPTLGDLRDARTCIYNTTPDGHFIIGPVAQNPNVHLASGFSGHGFKFAPAIAEELANRLLDGVSNPLFELFEPARFSATDSH